MEILTDSDLIKLISDASEERSDFDFKEVIKLDQASKKEKAELAKDIIAMANSGGGIIVGGVKQTESGFIRIGMPAELMHDFDASRINGFIREYCDPPINTTTRVLTVDGKILGVILIPGFLDQPHIVTQDSGVFARGDILARNGGSSSERVRPDELRKMLDSASSRRQGVLTDYLRNVFQQVSFLRTNPPSPKQELPINPKEFLKEYKGFRSVSVTPSSPLTISPMNLRAGIEKAQIFGRSRSVVPFINPEYNYSTEKRFPFGVAFGEELQLAIGLFSQFSFFSTTGFFINVDTLWEDSINTVHGPGSIGLFSTTAKVLASLIFAKRYFEHFKWRGAAKIVLSLESSVPRRIVLDSNRYAGYFRRMDKAISDPVSIERMLDFSISLPDIISLTSEMMRECCWYFFYNLTEKDMGDFMEVVLKDEINMPKDLLETNGEKP